MMPRRQHRDVAFVRLVRGIVVGHEGTIGIVDNHRVRILQKVQVSNTVELARLIFSTRPAARAHEPAAPPQARLPLADTPTRHEDELSLSAR